MIYDEVNVKFQAPFVSTGFTDRQGRCFNSVQSGTIAMDHFEKVPSNSGKKADNEMQLINVSNIAKFALF